MFYLPIKRNVLFLKTVCTFGSLFRFTIATSTAVGTASADDSQGPTLNLVSVNQSPLRLLSPILTPPPIPSFGSALYPWDSAVNLSSQTETRLAPEPAVNYCGTESSYHLARSAS